jgi:hypothetical protein
MLRDGRLHLSGIARLAPHLTRQNADEVLKRASGLSHREIRELVCELVPKPDVAPTIRKLPVRPSPTSVAPVPLGAPRVESSRLNSDLGPVPGYSAIVEPLAQDRHLVRFTVSTELREKLERLQALMRSSVPDGDLALIIGIAISEKLERVEAKRFEKTPALERSSRRPTPPPTHATSPQRSAARSTLATTVGAPTGTNMADGAQSGTISSSTTRSPSAARAITAPPT